MSDLIEFTNEYGQRIQMTRDAFREKVIPYNLEMYWDDREGLRQFAMQLVQDKFTEEAAKAADRLLELWGPIEPALVFRAVVHMQAGEFDQAKQLLVRTIEEHPTSGTAYTNLAKILLHEGDAENAFVLLEAGLMHEPNQENGLDWYVSSFLEAGKQEELMERLEKLGEQPGAWRPQLVMGRLALKDGNLLGAMQAFRDALERTGGREEAVMNVTGELGQAGYLYQLIQIAEEYWKPTFSFPYAGLNYASALVATDQKEKAAALLQEMLPHVSPQYREMVTQFLEQLPQAETDAEAGAGGEPAKDGETKKSWWKFW